MNSTHSKVGDVIKSRLLTVSHCSDAMLSRVCSYYVCRLNSGALLGTWPHPQKDEKNWESFIDI